MRPDKSRYLSHGQTHRQRRARDKRPMTIRFPNETSFEPEAIDAMGQAYECLLNDLGLTDRNDPLTAIVAKEIVKVASRGARDPAEIRVKVLAALDASKGSSGSFAYRS